MQALVLSLFVCLHLTVDLHVIVHEVTRRNSTPDCVPLFSLITFNVSLWKLGQLLQLASQFLPRKWSKLAPQTKTIFIFLIFKQHSNSLCQAIWIVPALHPYFSQSNSSNIWVVFTQAQYAKKYNKLLDLTRLAGNCRKVGAHASGKCNNLWDKAISIWLLHLCSTPSLFHANVEMSSYLGKATIKICSRHALTWVLTLLQLSVDSVSLIIQTSGAV